MKSMQYHKGLSSIDSNKETRVKKLCYHSNYKIENNLKSVLSFQEILPTALTENTSIFKNLV